MVKYGCFSIFHNLCQISVVFTKPRCGILSLRPENRNLRVHLYCIILTEYESTIVPPDVIAIGRKFGQKGLDTDDIYSHEDCIQAIRLLSLDASKYCVDQNRVKPNKYILKNLFLSHI